ncbi:ester cyclase [Streptomyces sp. CA-132043]|uniref:ester cyclase n=1 Tax=Streptomyces sp. CA-132043 TaxID=3240048 RepID=UPI003D8B4619
MSTTEARRKLIEQVWAGAWGRGDVDALDQLLGPSYLRHGGDGHAQNLSAFKASIVSTRSAFPDLVTTLDDVVVDGDKAAIRWHSSGTHENALLGVPATKRHVEVSGATFARFEGDRIVEEFVTWDPRALLSALGIIRVGQD